VVDCDCVVNDASLLTTLDPAGHLEECEHFFSDSLLVSRRYGTEYCSAVRVVASTAVCSQLISTMMTRRDVRAHDAVGTGNIALLIPLVLFVTLPALLILTVIKKLCIVLE